MTSLALYLHSPDNICVTENYAYVQEDPNGYYDDATKQHDSYLYQYNLNTGEVKVVLELNTHQQWAYDAGYSLPDDRYGKWELTGMIYISEEVGIEGTFILIAQAHSWYNDAFLNPDGAGTIENSRNEGSIIFVLQGLDR